MLRRPPGLLLFFTAFLACAGSETSEVAIVLGGDRVGSSPLNVLQIAFAKERPLSANERADTIADLSKLGSKPALKFLEKMARQEIDPVVSAILVEEMSRHPMKQLVVSKLLRFAKGQEWPLANPAMAALVELNYEKKENLLRALSASQTEQIQLSALDLLAGLGTEKGVETILTRFHHPSTSTTVRYSAYQFLRTYKHEIPEKTMLRAVQDDNSSICALGLEDLLASGHSDLEKLALRQVRRGKLRDPLASVLLRILGPLPSETAFATLLQMDLSLQPTLEPEILRNLAQHADLHKNSLVTGLRNRRSWVRMRSAILLLEYPDAEVSDALLKRLSLERDVDVQRLLFEGLGRAEWDRVPSSLLTMAKKRSRAQPTALRTVLTCSAGDGKVASLFKRMLKSSRLEERILAMDAIGATKTPGFGEAIAINLDHKAWQVRLTAAEVLGGIRDKRWIAPLIQRLHVEDRKRVFGGIGGALFALTGEGLHRSPSMWFRWWEDNQEALALPASAAVVPVRELGNTVAGFYGVPVDSNNVVFILDHSGSMSASVQVPKGSTVVAGVHYSRWDEAIAQARSAVAKMTKERNVNFLVFQDEVVPWQRKLVPMDRKSRVAAGNWLAGSFPQGGTNLYAALEAGLSIRNVEQIILLTDGEPSVGEYQVAEDILREIAWLNLTRKIALDCVSVGRESALLKKLARQNYGRYVSVGLPGKLKPSRSLRVYGMPKVPVR